MALAMVKIEGLDKLLRKANGPRLLRRPVRVFFRQAVRTVKARAAVLSRFNTGKLARRHSVKVDRAPMPQWGRVTNKHPGVHAIHEGRRPGARMPPPDAFRGGYAAARALARRGMAGRPWLHRAVAGSQGTINGLMRVAGKDIESLWRSL